MELSRHLRAKAKTIPGKEQFFWSAYARSFEVSFEELHFESFESLLIDLSPDYSATALLQCRN